MSDLSGKRPATPSATFGAGPAANTPTETFAPPSTLTLYWTAYVTIVRREIIRILRIWLQTLLPPAITMTLYFVIFGSLIGSRIGAMDGHSYMDFIAPGIIMMSVITNAYGNVVSSFFSAKYQRHIEELLVAPVPNWIVLAGYISGGLFRGLAVGAIVTVVALCFSDIHIAHPLITITTVLLTALLFSIGGLINAIFARSFDDVSIVPTFILTPLTYLGGVFYSVSLLPDFWQTVSLANPILYMVNAFRYGFLGSADIGLGVAYAVMLAFSIGLGALALYLLNTGRGLKS